MKRLDTCQSSFQNGPKSVQKSILKTHWKLDGFLNRFWSHLGPILGAKLGPCCPLFGPKMGGSNWVQRVLCSFGAWKPLLGPSGPFLGSIWSPWGRKNMEIPDDFSVSFFVKMYVFPEFYSFWLSAGSVLEHLFAFPFGILCKNRYRMPLGTYPFLHFLW